ncbi:MAG: hypothetical protein D6780_04300 [Candidatus Dadabacteria bacterium]|nr:MAG: hypothetical protein D6780_04300 [Candidatus Dadabacteria bacterium]
MKKKYFIVFSFSLSFLLFLFLFFPSTLLASSLQVFDVEGLLRMKVEIEAPVNLKIKFVAPAEGRVVLRSLSNAASLPFSKKGVFKNGKKLSSDTYLFQGVSAGKWQIITGNGVRVQSVKIIK